MHLEAIRSLIKKGGTTAALEEQNTHIIRRCRELRLIRLKTAWTTKGRHNALADKDRLAYQKEEWQSGKLRTDERGPWDLSDKIYERGKSSGFSYGRDTDFDWPQSELDRISKVAQEIQDFFNVQLPKKQGWVYFAHPETMPEVWSAPHCLRLMVCRFMRLKHLCNRHGVTVETPDTLFLLCVFIACVNRCTIKDTDTHKAQKLEYKAKYGEFLGLPVSIATHDPLRFTLAHIVHSQDMVSGFPVGCTSFDQFNSDANNLTMETCTSNYLKHDYPNSQYDTLREELIAKIQLPLTAYDPRITPSPADSRYRDSSATPVDLENFTDIIIDEEENQDMFDDLADIEDVADPDDG